MTDILIRVKETWERCADCPLYGWDEVGHCTADGRDVSFYAVEGKPSDCPSTKLPPHGDLIDRNELLSTKTDPIHKTMIFGGQYVISEDAIKNAPVVVPAERREE